MLDTLKEILKGAFSAKIENVRVELHPRQKPRRVIFRIAFKDKSHLTQVVGKPEDPQAAPTSIRVRSTRKKT